MRVAWGPLFPAKLAGSAVLWAPGAGAPQPRPVCGFPRVRAPGPGRRRLRALAVEVCPALAACARFLLPRVRILNVLGFDPDTQHGRSAERSPVSLVLSLIRLSSALKEMEKSDANNFLILFRDSGCQFRSLYTYCPETEDIAKLTGIGPKAITKKMIEGLYKYNSDRKQFSHIPAKTLSASVDAITIHSHLWQTKRPVTPKKLLPSKA